MALIGFGEAGSTFARAANWRGMAHAFDIDPTRRPLMEECGITACNSAEDALQGADVVLSLVTADSAALVAQDYAPFLKSGALFCDMNSIAPQTKQANARAVNEAGGRYVDIAVMAPVDPTALNVPLLIAGPDADEAEQRLNALGFAKTRITGADIGRASSIKMIRSVMVKGLEALTWECAAAADEAGVFDEVMTSLDASEKGWPWSRRVAYNRERMTTHGVRRAAEMEESAKTLDGFSVEPVMTRGTVIRQRQAAAKTPAKNSNERNETR
ncbi:NAD(P)-dependent oxidoreductase [Altericroceibacterium endophyticum]|uniref:NAD(P)-dependent oxidoreductase n=1 Tax=Altericroceibacterium endophyticum TaxID=1808508 RepID=UPI001F45FD48|nr:NAD(P)-dependent oxidoreductase [Altericroceibacterium endophyticum]